MKVLLISPTLTSLLPEDPGRPPLYEPIGLGYLAAATRERGIDVEVLDCYAEGWSNVSRVRRYTRVGLSEEAIRERIREAHPDVVGIPFQFTGFDRDAKRIAALAKEVLPETPVVVGGADASARSREISRDRSVDVVVRGEGEPTFLAILEWYEREGRIPPDLAGTTVNGEDNPPRDEIEDVNSLPFPARDLLPMDIYLEDQSTLMPYAKRGPIGFMISSRGCPYNCVFCSTTKVWRRWRPRSPESVVQEIELLVREYGVREIAFQDDSFLVDPERVRRICEEILRRKIDITWSVPPGLQANRLTEDLLAVMKRSGFYRACFPIESGDPCTLEWIRKPLDLEEVEEAIELCHRMGIWTYGNFIIGFPEETAESMERTAEYAINCRLDMISVYVAQPYAGSDLYEDFDRLGLLDPEKAAGSTVFNTLYDTVNFSAEELRAKRAEIYSGFMKRRVLRALSPRGFVELCRKMKTPGALAYGLRVGRILLASSLKAGQVSLFGKLADTSDDD